MVFFLVLDSSKSERNMFSILMHFLLLHKFIYTKTFLRYYWCRTNFLCLVYFPSQS